MTEEEAANTGDQQLAGDITTLAHQVQQDLPSRGAPWRVFVRCPDGAPSAAFTLGSYDQVLLFEERVERFGYQMLMLDERFRQCDFAPGGALAGR